MNTNPYQLLKLPSDATTEEVDAAYERLFDRYEPRATAGDEAAVAMLERLNDAYDTLSDPQRRAGLNRELGIGKIGAKATATRTSMQDKGQAQSRPARSPVTGSGRTGPGSQSIRTRSRSQQRSRYVPEKRRYLPIVPIFLIGVLGFALAALITYMIVSRNNNATPNENRGSVVATVNGQPIYEQDYLERSEMDKNGALADPFFGVYFETLTPFSQTQVLETLKSDALDRLINLEMLQQQARKEGLYPETPEQQRSVLDEAKNRELKGQDFAEFLKQRNITEGQYNRRIIRNVVYTLMADAHMPKEGSDEARKSAFFTWICETRKSYDVRINITFAAPNDPCTSDLPPELALPGIDTLPEPEATAIVPTTPQGPQGPQGPPGAPTPTK